MTVTARQHRASVKAGYAIIPAGDRIVVLGHSRFCPSCVKLTRNDGPCPGLVPMFGDHCPPVCHVDADTGASQGPSHWDLRPTWGSIRAAHGAQPVGVVEAA